MEDLSDPTTQAEVAVDRVVSGEPLDDIGVHDLAPDVGVVGNAVAPGEDAGEVDGAVVGRYERVIDSGLG